MTPRELRDEDFLSGQTGHVAGRRAVLRRAGDLLYDLISPRRLPAVAPRDVLVASIYRPPARPPELSSDHHHVEHRLGSTGEATLPGTVASGLAGGKFQNLNAVIGDAAFDWLIVVDDDVELPARFIDRFIGACEVFGFDLAQPAQTLSSHAAWPITRRRPGIVARETRFVEIGPVTAFSKRAATGLLPFPELRFGWGLDLHWAALARERGWKLGIVDALPVKHERSPVASGYGFEEAIAEAREFLAGRPFLKSDEVVRVYRRP